MLLWQLPPHDRTIVVGLSKEHQSGPIVFGHRGRFHFMVGSLILGGLTVLLRLPLLNAPLTVDEGGYGYVARMWSRGVPLYRVAWVDRPQGLLLVFRAAFAVFGDSERTIRGLAALFAAGTVVVVAEIARRITKSPVAGFVAGFLYAMLSATPQFEGYTANGELLSALPTATCILLFIVAVQATSSRRRRAFLFATGLVGASALLVKQSAYDALVVTALALIMNSWQQHKRPNRAAVFDALWFGLGALLPLGAAAVHGATLGWSDWWFAVAGYRFSVENVTSGTMADRIARYQRSFRLVQPHYVPMVGFAAIGLVGIRRRNLLTTIPILWFIVSLSAFLLGGLFHTHYYMGLVPSIAVSGALGMHALWDRWRIPVLIPALVGLALFVPSAQYSLRALTKPTPDQRSLYSAFDSRLPPNRAVAKWLDEHTQKNEPFYALYANAALYYVADRPAPLKFLWERGVARIPGALDELASLLNSPQAPRFIVRETSPTAIPGGSRIAEILERRYHEVIVIERVPILELNASEAAIP
jgi:4-amino-4-deoxy-L-arabinose transferase-like glycosyltransferase